MRSSIPTSSCMSISLPHFVTTSSRREFLARAGGGFGALALASLLSQGQSAAASMGGVNNPIAPKTPEYPAPAKSVIWCFIDGGPSHIDLFDPKPASRCRTRSSAR
jgi:hypothetical protein